MQTSSLLKKSLAVGIILLFIGTAIIPSNGQKIEKSSLPASRGHWLYVGGSGPGNYTRIQDAIDNASNGDTVFVYDDSSPYHEHIVINTSVSLIGEDRNTTIIQGNNFGDSVIEVNVNASISELTIEKYNHESTGIYVRSYYIYCTIDNNIIRNCYAGIALTNFNIVQNNEIYNCTKGIAGYDSSNIIKHNIIHNNSWYGIIFYIGSNNVITQNIITHNAESGIGFLYPQENLISNNVITSNRYGITDSIYYSGNRYKYNIVLDNSRYGFYMRGENASVIGNVIGFNGEYGIYATDGSNNTHVFHNNFIENSVHAYDDGFSNYWDDGYPSGGNYWDDYNGSDSNGDGIGDIPYNIPGGGYSQDRYPLMNSWEHKLPVANFTYTINQLSATFNTSSSYDSDGYITSWLWDFGDGAEGAGEIITHDYLSSGTYLVTLTVVSDDGDEASITREITVEKSGYQEAFIFGRLTNFSSQEDYITFQAVKIRVITFKPFSFHKYVSGEMCIISKAYLGLLNDRYIFALCKIMIHMKI